MTNEEVKELLQSIINNISKCGGEDEDEKYNLGLQVGIVEIKKVIRKFN